MRSGQLLVVLACAGAACSAAPAASPAATSGTVFGKLSGAAVPPRSRGVADVKAIRLDTGVVAAARRLGRSGAYTLKLPPGPYVVVGTVLDRVGRTLVTRAGPPLSLRAGQRRKVPLPLRRAKRKKRGAKRPARASYVQESGKVTPGVIAIEVRDFTGATGELAFLNRGITDMLHTDMVNGAGGCPTVLVANARDRAVLATELQLQNSPYVDPATRVTRDFTIPDVAVKGRLVDRAGALAYAITVSDARTGSVIGSRSGELKLDPSFFSSVDAIAPALLRLICNPPPRTPPPPPPPPPKIDPDGLTGTFSGDLDFATSPAPVPIRLRWTGTLDLVRQPYGLVPLVTYVVRAGSASVTISGTAGGCSVDGTTVVDLVASNLGLSLPALVVEAGDHPSYRAGVASQLGQVTGVKSACADPINNGEQVVWPLLGVGLVQTPDPQTSGSRFAFNGTLNGRPTPADPLYNWTWSLSGSP